MYTQPAVAVEMGNMTLHRPRRSGDRAPLIVSPPQSALLAVPSQERDTITGRPLAVVPVDINREQILQGLQLVAQDLHAKGQDVTIVTVGGAVNSLYLQTRDVTHDVDFFSVDLAEKRKFLSRASKRAATTILETHGVRMGIGWLNNETTVWIPDEIRVQLCEEANEQDEFVFNQPGLRVLAAPWDYAFSAKLNRIYQGEKVRPYDGADAAHYLHRHNERHGGRPTTGAEVDAWAKRYRHTFIHTAVAEVNAYYLQVYGTDGVVAINQVHYGV